MIQWRRRGTIRATVAASALVALALAACAPGEDNEGGEEAAPSDIETNVADMGDITLTVWDQQVRGGQADSIDQLNAAFEEAYPNVTIDRVSRSFADLQRVLRLAIQDDEAPDVVQANNNRSQMGAFVEAGLLRSLDGYADVYGWNDRFPASIRAHSSYSDDGTVFGSGNLYGLPQTGELIGVWYNKQKLDELGIEPPQTLADFEAALQAAKDAGEIPIQFGNKDQWPGIHTFGFLQNMYASRDEVRAFGYGNEGGDWTDDANATAAETLQKWVDAGYFTDGFNGLGYDPSWQDFSKGEGVFMISGSWLLADLRDAMGDDVGFMLPPVGDTGELTVTGATGLPFAIPTEGDNADAAAAYINFITSPEAMNILTDAGELPVVGAEQQQVSGTQAEVFDAWQTATSEDALVPYLDWGTPDAYDVITTNVQSYMGGDSSADELLGTLEDDYSSFVSENSGG
ncbi:MAG TPA: extracellular solute-binding protein [Nocardioidaceae bacterium]|nr:extracellular solute-binding protein [Nocardioidaceae bacterium]